MNILTETSSTSDKMKELIRQREMEGLKEWNLFGEIKQYKAMGLNKSQVQRELNINYKTVDKYWDMLPDEYAELRVEAKNRSKKIDWYKDEILDWITDFRDMSAAQVIDWFQERHYEINFTERSLRGYISNLRKVYNLPKTESIRQFEEVLELPMGYQVQVDMGQIWLKKLDRTKVKIYCFAMVLAHSRYKYILWSDKPFTTVSFIDAHNRAFEYYGGMPAEIVYDQDRVLTVFSLFESNYLTEYDVQKHAVKSESECGGHPALCIYKSKIMMPYAFKIHNDANRNIFRYYCTDFSRWVCSTLLYSKNEM